MRRSLPTPLRRALLSVGAAGLLASAGCGARGLTRHQLEHGGRTREYWLRPTPGEPTRYAGLVLALHGGGGRGRGFAWGEGGILAARAAADGFLVAYPQGIDRRWNDGRLEPQLLERSRAHREGVDDVGFLTELVAHLQRRYAIPADQVFVCGISNGGRMTLRLLMDRPEVFRGAGVVAMSLSEELWARRDAAARPVPVAFLHGTEDPLVPYDGGQIQVFRRRHGPVLGAPESAARFAEAYGCTGRQERPVPDRDPGDGTRTTRIRFTGCRDGAEVVLDREEGGGHTWPGGTQYLPRLLVGGTVRDYHGSDMLWDFWTRHGLVPGPSRP